MPQGNPLLNILYGDSSSELETPLQPQEEEAPAKEEVKSVKSAAPKKSKKVTKGELEEVIADLSAPKPPRPESRSKRLNLLVKPSTLSEISKIAEKYSISVNELINRLLEACVKNEK